MKKNLGRENGVYKKYGRFFVQFSDRVYELKKLFDFQIGSTFEPKMPAIVALSHEIRSMSLRIRGIYGRIEGICGCLEELDKALYAVDKLALTGPVDAERKEAIRRQLEDLSWRLANIWSCDYDDGYRGWQAALADYPASG